MEDFDPAQDCGLDEVGRGPLAGPVCAASVILGPNFPLEILADSKKLSEGQRETAFPVILERAVAWGVGWVWPAEIDAINIHRASLLAMERAFAAMKYTPRAAFVDGLYCPPLGIPSFAVVKGDDKIPAISAASIIAKVIRDRWMVRWSWIDDRYGFEKHKGYPTEFHRRALDLHGPSGIHRRSFQFKVPWNLELGF